MLFADEPFWKPPNVFDVLSVVAFVVGVGSVWFSWWLAKRDIRRRLAEAAEQAATAARDEVRRVARALLQTGLRDVIRALDLAREACRGKRIERATELLEVAREQLVRVAEQPQLSEPSRAAVNNASMSLRDCIEKLRQQPMRAGIGKVPDEVRTILDEALMCLHRVDAACGAIRAEQDDGQ
jgi:hypothetical protein